MSSIPARNELYSKKTWYKLCQWRAVGRWFSLFLRFQPPINFTATLELKYCWKWRLTTITITQYCVQMVFLLHVLFNFAPRYTNEALKIIDNYPVVSSSRSLKLSGISSQIKFENQDKFNQLLEKTSFAKMSHLTWVLWGVWFMVVVFNATFNNI